MNHTHAPEESLAGSVERITFHSEESGFCVLRVKVKGNRDLMTVIGHTASIHAGEYVECKGIWINDRQHGLQFKATLLKVVPPTTLAGIEKYLSSGMVKGIGAHFAKKLVKAFGNQVFDVIENHPDRLTTLDGIGEKRKAWVVKSWAEQKAIRDIMVFLQSHGVGTSRSVRIYKTYGDQAIEIVRNNPYQLALDIHGIGFKTADIIAARLGIAKDSLIRAQAGTRHALQTLCESGHCAVEEDQLIKAATELLEVESGLIVQAIKLEIQEERLISEPFENKALIYPISLYIAEIKVSEKLKILSKSPPPWGKIDIEEAIPWVEQKTGFLLSDSQKEAIALVACHKVSIITGGPGVGKTTVVNSLLKVIQAKKMRIALCAPTGRAAKRLSESTGLTAKTIHRMLEFDPKTYSFKYNQHNPLPFDLIVMDEASMLDIVLTQNVLQSLSKNTAIIFIGDVDQLPSVGSGQVLQNMIESEQIATARLTQIFRQAAGSNIIINAHRINEGKLPLEYKPPSDFYTIFADTPEEIHNLMIKVITQRIPERYGFSPKQDIQVLTPMNRGGLGARSLNIILQEVLNGKAQPKITRFGMTFAPGDKVIQMRNNYDKDVFNGDIGTIKSIDEEEGLLYIDYDGNLIEYEFSELDEVALAYSISIHKSQGSEYPVVVIPISTQHYAMLARNLLYTGVTRGKKLVILIGQKKAIYMAVKNFKRAKRQTLLKERLTQMQWAEA